VLTSWAPLFGSWPPGAGDDHSAASATQSLTRSIILDFEKGFERIGVTVAPASGRHRSSARLLLSPEISAWFRLDSNVSATLSLVGALDGNRWLGAQRAIFA
jgi:hypothetical protein